MPVNLCPVAHDLIIECLSDSRLSVCSDCEDIKNMTPPRKQFLRHLQFFSYDYLFLCVPSVNFQSLVLGLNSWDKNPVNQLP